MNKTLKNILIDAKETLEHIVQSDAWQELKEGSSAEEVISDIDKFLNKE